jgi:hypothetical protein
MDYYSTSVEEHHTFISYMLQENSLVIHTSILLWITSQASSRESQRIGTDKATSYIIIANYIHLMGEKINPILKNSKIITV